MPFIMRCLACHAHEAFAMAFEAQPDIGDSVAQESDTFNEIGAAFKVKGDFKDA